MTLPFRYYIFDTYAGVVTGTHDVALAEQLGSSDQYFVVEPISNRWILGNTLELQPYVEEFSL